MKPAPNEATVFESIAYPNGTPNQLTREEKANEISFADQR
jgi:hypothetical protein